MAHKNLQLLVKEWIRNDEDVTSKWEIQETEDNQVVVTGKLQVSIDTNAFRVAGSCCTANDDESIGRAMQTINDGILCKLQKI